MKIDSLKSSPDRAGRYWITLSDGSSMRLYRQTVEDFCLYSGKELSDDEYKKLCRSAGEMSAKMRAVRIISASNVSQKDLERRLVQKGESSDDAHTAVAWLENMSLLDDSRTAEQIVHSCIAKGYGPARAKQVLYEKRIPKNLWEEALKDYPDQTDAIRKFLQGKLGQNYTPKDVKKAVDALMRRGHSYRDIRKVLCDLADDLDEYMEEY